MDPSIENVLNEASQGLEGASSSLMAAGSALNPNDPGSLLQYQTDLTMFENDFQTVSSVVSGMGNMLKSMIQNVH